MVFRAIKRLTRWLVGELARLYLSVVRLDSPTADRWAVRIKKWPGFLSRAAVERDVQVAGGAEMRVGLIDLIERSLLTTGTWEPHVVDFITEHLRPGGCFLDIGANVGFFTLVASRIVGPEGLVVAMEPNHRNLGRLCSNLATNHVENVVVLSAAAGSRFGIGRISASGASNSGTACMRPTQLSRYTETLEVRLDDFLLPLGVVPSVVKIDVEGFEFRVLKGMEQALRSHQPAVALELTDAFLKEMGHSARELVQYMESLGYECRVLGGGGAFAAGSKLRSSDHAFPEFQMDVFFIAAGGDDEAPGFRSELV